MARKARQQFSEDLAEARKMQWECLRLHEGYIRDCERWSRKLSGQWKRNEIIIGYPFNGNFRDYYDRHRMEWANLIATKEEHRALRAMGLRPQETPRQFTWHPYWKRWEINLPLNPSWDRVPFFVRIAPYDLISEPRFAGVENDTFLEKGTDSLIRVNWAAPATYLQHAFSQLVAEKKLWLAGGLKGRQTPETLRKKMRDTQLRGLKEKPNRPPLHLIEKYLKVWKLRKRDVSYLDIILEVFKDEFETDPDRDETAVLKKARRYYRQAEKLIDKEGYKKLGGHFGGHP